MKYMGFIYDWGGEEPDYTDHRCRTDTDQGVN